VTSALPLFPLRTVLFPGLVMPLRIFEERYRALVRDLLDLPTGVAREFGIVAIERGGELLEDVPDMVFYRVGCTAEIRQITRHEDGRFDLVTVGRRRFAIERLLAAQTPYLQAEVSYLAEQPGRREEALAPRVLSLFRRYLGLLRSSGASLAEQLPEDPVVLSNLVAATATLTLADRQSLLAISGTEERLRAELALLHREVGLLTQVRAVPASAEELGGAPASPN
jgi:hypothetical protein